MPLSHDPEYTARHYDAYGEREWERHEATWADRTSFAIHCDYLAKFVRPGDLVLDAGAGPGRFTIELAKLGARVHVGDLSEVQLRLNAQRVQSEGWEGAVASRVTLDICDLSTFPDGQFDAVVCFGGPISYVMDRAEVALRELCRVTRPGGHVLLSVMSTVGAARRFLPQVLDEGREFGPEYTDEVLQTGDLARATNAGHECHMYRWSELSQLLVLYGEIVGASATNFLTAQHDEALDAASDTEREQILRWELELCREPGALDGGTHILAVLQTPDDG
jgi:ubiquinone/menaquinone biosynthesis C-methylase UbiE